MDGSAVLDTSIGLVFVFLTASLVCTAVVEYVSTLLNKRGEYLLLGLREMLDIPPAAPSDAAAGTQAAPPTTAPPLRSGLLDGGHRGRTQVALRRALQDLSRAGERFGSELVGTSGGGAVRPPAPLADLVLSHPVVATLHRPLRPGRTGPSAPGRGRGGEMRLASYLSSRTFASALLDLLVPDAQGRTSLDDVQSAIGRIEPGIPGRDALLALLRDAGGDLARFRASIEQWYDEQMARVSGWYKRWAQWRLLAAGLVLAVAGNVDALRIAATLYRDSSVRTSLVATGLADGPCGAGEERAQCLAEQWALLRELPLPIGWDGVQPPWERGAAALLLALLGWLLTAAAVSFGAPFWYDALSRLGSLRTAGRRPRESASGQ